MPAPLAAFTDVQMLRLDMDGRDPDVYYVTPFVGDGDRLYVLDEPGERSDALEAMLLDAVVTVSARATGDLRVDTIGRRPTPEETAWARDACSARFHYDQALQDIAQLGAIVVLDPAGDDPGGRGSDDAGEQGDGDAGEQTLTLDADTARVVAALAEKALATPQNYPLSMNALVAACNQATSRDPVSDLSEGAVMGILDDCKQRGLVRFVHPRSGRGVTKYRHVLDEALGLDEAGTALLAVLVLRGPQTVAELRSRTERMAPLADAAAVEAALTELVDRSGHALARRLTREPGHREPRWIQLVCPAQGTERAGAAVEDARETPSDGPGAAAQQPRSAQPPAADLAGEVAELRAEVARLRADVDGLLTDR